MEDQAGTKICPMCAETIKAAAKVCPHCRYWQNKWSFANPAVAGSLFAVVFIIVMAGFGIVIDKMVGPKEPISGHRDEISVLSSHFTHRIAGSNLLVTVVGTVTNRGNYSWKNVGVEAQFLDASGMLIDAITADADYRGVALMPHGSAAFKIEGKAAQPQTNYASHRTFVRWAKDADAWP